MKKIISPLNIALLIILAAWIAVPLPVGSAAPTSEKEAVAIVNGVSIPKTLFDVEFEQRLNQMKSRGQQPDEEQTRKLKEWTLNGLIHQTLLFQESQKKKITVTQEDVTNEVNKLKQQLPDENAFKKFLEGFKMSEKEFKERIGQNLAVQKLIEAEISKGIAITPKELREFYDTHPELFEQPEQVKASHILVKVAQDADEKTKKVAMDKIKGVQAELKKGGDFAELARKNSDCPSSTKGGDLGYFRRGQMVKPFEETAFSQKPNQISDVVTTQFGYHLIKTFDKKAKGTVPFDEVKERLEAHLKQQKTTEAAGKYIENLKKDAKIETLLKL